MDLTLNYSRKDFWNHYANYSDGCRNASLEDALKAFKFICTNDTCYFAALFCGNIRFTVESSGERENGIVTVAVMNGGGIGAASEKKMSVAKAKKHIKELFAEEEKETGAAE